MTPPDHPGAPADASKSTASPEPASNQQPDGKADKKSAALSALIADLLQTREMRELIGNAAPELIRAWAGDSRLRQAAAAPVGENIRKNMNRSARAAGGFSTLLDDPSFTAHLADAMPGLIDGLIAGASQFARHLEALPPEARKAYLERLMAAEHIGRLGELVTVCSRLTNRMYADNPRLLTEALMPIVRDWIEKTDFGELRDTLEHGTGDVQSLISEFWMLMRQYPAKVVTLLSAMPNLLNILICALKETAGTISSLFQSPDMITDFMLSVLRRIDGQALGELINAFCELSRQLHAGSGLLGEPGAPVFRRDLSALLDGIIETVDAEVFNKARRGLAEGRETLDRVFMEKLRTHPDQFISYLHTANEIRNIRIQTLNEKFSLFEDMAEEGLSDALAQGVTGLNSHDLAEIVNSISRSINRLRDESEGFDLAVLAEFANGVDIDELSGAVKWACGRIGPLLRPVGRAFAPQIVQMICGWAVPEDGDFDDADADMQKAVNALKQVLTGQGVGAGEGEGP